MGNSSTRAKAKYNKENYDTHLLRLPKNEKEKLKLLAKKAGLSLNAYILQKAKNNS
ncbi:MAG: hypothetical protein RLY43_11 [Bacteroidota bacterium]|jgi:predicted HicB family RNase H-like nuclease